MQIDNSVKSLKMKTFVVVLVVMVFGRCVLSDSDESAYTDDNTCPASVQLNKIHPISMIGYLSCMDELPDLLVLYVKYWNLAYKQSLPSADFKTAQKYQRQFNVLFDYYFNGNQPNLDIVKKGLMNMQNKLFPDQQADQLNCGDDPVFTISEEGWGLW
ncbi:uncharacterized protein LOC126836668 [Adelges cooleyi]|uniref:uncharacterized protein LOC126836668 n=1 Tax=Adelges cooleyi TaxID=133065 RepID=UPI00217FAB84|nr:uncharacterized protein LOC126836668 [Adelges cooleyi]